MKNLLLFYLAIDLVANVWFLAKNIKKPTLILWHSGLSFMICDLMYWVYSH